jgi:hypothetical protein
MPNGGKRPGAGRPKGTIAGHTLLAQEMKKALIERAAEEWGPIIDALIHNAKHGDTYATRELLDRIFGKASQGVELTGKDGQPIKFEQITGMTISLASGQTISTSTNGNPVPDNKS